jgi:hypothetical protein
MTGLGRTYADAGVFELLQSASPTRATPAIISAGEIPRRNGIWPPPPAGSGWFSREP